MAWIPGGEFWMGADLRALCEAGERAGWVLTVGTAIEFLRDRLAYFMIPRYLRVLPELPKTASSKVLKTDLRTTGVTAGTWDREKAGIVVKRDKIGS